MFQGRGLALDFPPVRSENEIAPTGCFKKLPSAFAKARGTIRETPTISQRPQGSPLFSQWPGQPLRQSSIGLCCLAVIAKGCSFRFSRKERPDSGVSLGSCGRALKCAPHIPSPIAIAISCDLFNSRAFFSRMTLSSSSCCSRSMVRTLVLPSFPELPAPPSA